MVIDQSYIDGRLFIAENEADFLEQCRRYGIRWDYDSFDFRGPDPNTQENVTIIRRYGKFQKEADKFLKMLK